MQKYTKMEQPISSLVKEVITEQKMGPGLMTTEHVMLSYSDAFIHCLEHCRNQGIIIHKFQKLLLKYYFCINTSNISGIFSNGNKIYIVRSLLNCVTDIEGPMYLLRGFYKETLSLFSPVMSATVEEIHNFLSNYK